MSSIVLRGYCAFGDSRAVEVLRGYFAFGDSRAVEVSDDMIQIGCEQIESGITTVVSLCTESRYVQMAEHAVRHIHDSNGHATLAMYSALMYSHARMYHKICDLYVSMKWDDAEVDMVIYGSFRFDSRAVYFLASIFASIFFAIASLLCRMLCLAIMSLGTLVTCFVSQ